MWQTYYEEKRVRVGQMWPRAGSERIKRLGDIPSQTSTVRPEPFGSEQFGLELTAERLKAELLTAEGSRRWRAIEQAQRSLVGRGHAFVHGLATAGCETAGLDGASLSS